MPETPDLKALAERYLDLWEEQFAAAAADPALAAAMAAWLGPWRTLASGTKPPGAAPAGDARRKTDDRAAATARKTGTNAAAGSPPAAAASRDGGSGLDRILERLERIERRLDALERKRVGKSESARGRPRGRAGGGRTGGAG
jgi:hypothetical protein